MNELIGKDVKISLILDGRTGFFSRRVHVLDVENGFLKCLDYTNHVTYYALSQIKSINMLTNEDYLITNEVLSQIVETIKDGEYEVAKERICHLVGTHVEDERLYNLLGICFEKIGDKLKASKFYRMAYYLNQSFSAPEKNLQNLTTLRESNDAINWGIEVSVCK